MDIDTTQAFKLGFLVIIVLLFTIVLTAYYPQDFNIFGTSLLMNIIRFDAVVIASWIAILTGGALFGFFTSGKSFDIALTGLILSLCILFYPMFLYILNVFTLGMFNYPNLTIHTEVPLILLLLISIPMSVVVFYLAFDLVTSAIQSVAGE